jgi:predicted ABC-type sugar transport system permease subunit
MKLASFLGLAAMGQTIVILTGCIDLSIAWVLTASAVVFTSWNIIGPWALALAADPAASVPAEGASLKTKRALPQTSKPSNGPLRFQNSV